MKKTEKTRHEIMNAFWDLLKEIVPLACSLNILDENVPNFEYVVTYIFSSLFGLMTYWYENGKDISMDEFTKITQTLITKGTFGISKNK